jgi:hypothetical protein
MLSRWLVAAALGVSMSVLLLARARVVRAQMGACALVLLFAALPAL